MPRSFATAGAETMLISASIGRSTPASAAAESGRTFSARDFPLEGDVHAAEADWSTI